ncbi:MAG: SBBP repeat-containing protein [Chitinophagaceae bacterium]|nr:SBBP repeat-containing protein [Chitinophagaceae bacterium]
MKKNFTKKALLFVLLLSTFASYAQVQEVWTRSFSYNNGSNDVAEVIAVDMAGNVYVAGASSPRFENYLTIIKYDGAGNEIWRKVFGDRDDSYYWQIHPVEIFVDNNYVYVAATSNADGNVFTVVKYDLDGNFRWLKRFAGVGNFDWGHATDMSVDLSGYVYVTGYIAEEASLVPLTQISNYFTVKLDGQSGDQLWVRTYNGADPGNGTNIPSSMVVDPTGNVYITGTSLLNGQFDIATIKYSTTGVLLWIRRYAGALNSDDGGNDIALDANNNVYITGYTTETDDNINFITIKYSADGDQQWLRTYNGYEKYIDRALVMTIDGDNNVYVAGITHELATTQGNSDFLTIKYNTDGAQLWTSRYNGSLIEGPDDIVLDGNNNIYITGQAYPSKIVTFRLNSGDGSQSWVKEFTPRAGDFLFLFTPKVSLAVDANANVFVCGGVKPSVENENCDFITIKYSQCAITCPDNITVNAASGTCSAVVTYPEATTSGACGSEITYSHASGSSFPVGTTTVTVTSTETGATCTFDVTVVDNQPPVFTNCPSNKTVNTDAGVCYASVSSVNAGTATATDNCSVTVTPVRSDSLTMTDNFPVGITTITWLAIDAANDTVTCTQTITVVDNIPPTISGVSVSKTVLSPPNHKMADVTVDFTVTDNCSATTTVTVTSDEAETGLSNGDKGPDIIKIDDKHWQLRAERDGKGDGRVYTITITATDASNNVTTETRTVVVAHNIGSPHSGAAFKVGSTVNFAGTFWDVTGNKHTAQWLIDEKTTAKATVSEPSGMKNGTITGSYKFTTPGVYKLQMNITDQKGVTTTTNTNGDLQATVVVYDPNGGHTFGGGYFASPAGALKNNPAVAGNVSYGFTVNYFKSATYPKGETQLDFQLGDFEFNALNFDYLVISSVKAQFKGTGKITGDQGGYAFIMTVIDGLLDGSGTDKVRMKIFNKNTGDVIYDNQPGVGDGDDPVMPVGENSIVTISSNSTKNRISNTASVTINNKTNSTETEVNLTSTELEMNAYPNPTSSWFNLKVKSPNHKDRIVLQVTDLNGKVIETRAIVPGQNITIGQTYRPGAYFVRIVQGKEQKQAKLIKLN